MHKVGPLCRLLQYQNIPTKSSEKTTSTSDIDARLRIASASVSAPPASSSCLCSRSLGNRWKHHCVAQPTSDADTSSYRCIVTTRSLAAATGFQSARCLRRRTCNFDVIRHPLQVNRLIPALARFPWVRYQTVEIFYYGAINVVSYPDACSLNCTLRVLRSVSILCISITRVDVEYC